MGGAELAALLLCLLSRAPLPGLAQEVVTGADADRRSQSPAAAAVPPVVTSAGPAPSGAGGSEFAAIVPGGEETIRVTGPPAGPTSPEITAAESSPGAAMTGASHDPTTDSPTTGPNLTQPPPTRSVTEDVTTGPLSSLTESPLAPRTLQPPDTQTQLSTETPPDHTRPTTAALTSWISTIATSLLTTTVLPTNSTSPARPHTTRAQVHRGPSVQEVGDNKEVPGFHSGNSSNPLFVMIVSVFTIVVVMVVVGIGFHRYKKRSRRTEFRRLQDLPMDDMMEDTPLSLYSY